MAPQKTLNNVIQLTTHEQLMDTHADNLHPEAMKSLTWRVLTCRVENGVVGSQSRRGGLEIWLRNVRRFEPSKVPAQIWVITNRVFDPQDDRRHLPQSSCVMVGNIGFKDQNPSVTHAMHTRSHNAPNTP